MAHMSSTTSLGLICLISPVGFNGNRFHYWNCVCFQETKATGGPPTPETYHPKHTSSSGPSVFLQVPSALPTGRRTCRRLDEQRGERFLESVESMLPAWSQMTSMRGRPSGKSTAYLGPFGEHHFGADSCPPTSFEVVPYQHS